MSSFRIFTQNLGDFNIIFCSSSGHELGDTSRGVLKKTTRLNVIRNKNVVKRDRVNFTCKRTDIHQRSNCYAGVNMMYKKIGMLFKERDVFVLRKKEDEAKQQENNNEKWEITPTLNGLLCACLTHQLVNWAACILFEHNIFLFFCQQLIMVCVNSFLRGKNA